MKTSSTRYSTHFGVYALVYNDARDSLLLIKKVRGCYAGMYDLPGGAMEPHELLEETLTREVFEETGCYVTKSHQLGAFSALYPFIENDGLPKTLRHLAALYEAEIAGDPLAFVENDQACVWVPLKDITAKNTVPLALLALNKNAGKAA